MTKKDPYDWLDGVPSPRKKGVTVEQLRKSKRILLQAGVVPGAPKAGAKLTNEMKRFPSMVKKLVGRSRCWASDGEYVAFRRALANPATLERHNKFIAAGNYQHVTTQDDVEIYKLMEGSPFKRTGMSLTTMKYSDIRRAGILAACAGDWPLFVDILTEMSSQLKGKFHEGMAKQIYEAHLTHMFSMIEQRRGPSRATIDAGVRSIRSKRGEDRGRVILIPDSHPVH